VRQAANFNNARLLLEYLQSEPGNKEVNRAINTFPLESSLKSKYVYRQQSFEIHMTPAMQVVENFERVKSLLTAAKKIKQIAPVDTISVE
jgi:hypothetical protein